MKKLLLLRPMSGALLGVIAVVLSQAMSNNSGKPDNQIAAPAIAAPAAAKKSNPTDDHRPNDRPKAYTGGYTDRATANIKTLADEEIKQNRDIALVTFIIRPNLSTRGQVQKTLSLVETSQSRVDDILRSTPGVTLFRRANSLSAHPTTQGLTLRGVGANGAGRVLVTLDGVPLNDPFGGWINWSAINSDNFTSATLYKGGGTGVFGSQALAGAIELHPTVSAYPPSSLTLEYGTQDSYLLSARHHTPFADQSSLSLSYKHFETDGFFLIGPEQRGPIDARAASRVDSFRLALNHKIGDWLLAPSVRFFEESRVNGLSEATNQTRGLDASFKIEGRFGNWQTEGIFYANLRELKNIFAAARDNRTTERPVLNQVSVPGNGYGFLLRTFSRVIEAGVDGRFLDGNTDELFRNLGAGFTRNRQAGGRQWIIGGFGEYDNSWGDLSLSATGRIDIWRSYDGSRGETDLADGAVLRLDTNPDQNGILFTGRVGGAYRLTPNLELRGAIYRSWRLPSLNEFYRPFRVVNDITEANALLVPETLTGGEIGIDFTKSLNGPAQNHKKNGKTGSNGETGFSVTFFQHHLSNGVGNITVGIGPGFFPLGGFVPEGGVLRQRSPIDRIKTTGLEISAFYTFSHIRLFADYLYADATISAFEDNPDLIGLRPVQTPEHSATIGANWAKGPIKLTGDVRYQSVLFDDDLNNRTLPSIITANLAIFMTLTDRLSLYVRGENIFDRRIVSAKTADGLETLAAPRQVRIGLSAHF